MLLTSFEIHADLTDALNQIGQLFVPLLQANGIDWHTQNAAGQRRDLVLQVLRQIPVLWIWDNVEPVAGFPEGCESAWMVAEQQELADFLKQLKLDKATKAKLLLTSRRDEQRWLGGTPKRIKMPRMSDSDAGALALALGEDRGLTRAGLSHWQPLLNYCAGNPLTLRVVAGQALSLGLQSRAQISGFIQKLRDGEQAIGDIDGNEGRDRSLGASLAYGFRNAFSEDELPVIALLCLFQGVVDVDALLLMGEGDYTLSGLQSQSAEQLHGLLRRACDIGLLTHIGSDWYGIHPALPWFLRQMFQRHYDGLDKHADGETVLRAWVEAIGELGDYYCEQFNEGNRELIDCLNLEEANLLHAWRLARRHAWWSPVTSSMQGLKALYQYQGRMAEWARLAAAIVPDYCMANDEPVAGRETDYSLVMSYRVELAWRQQRDLTLAADLQDKVVQWDKLQAAGALAVPEDQSLDTVQRNRVRTLAASLQTLGNIQREQGDGDCVAMYREAINYCQRIGDSVLEAISHFNLGHAYLIAAVIRDLDAAEAAYQRSLDLLAADDALGRVRCLYQIGRVARERFNEARQHSEPPETLRRYAERAETRHLEALQLCPKHAITDLGPIHNSLGNLYSDFGQTELARKHYEERVQLAEQTGDRYGAGQTRYNLSLMYERAAQNKADEQQRDLLHRARAYAEAALRDFQSYQGHVAADEAKTQQQIASINLALSRDQ